MKVTIRHVKPDEDFKKFMKDLFKLRENNFVVDLPLHRVKQLFTDVSKFTFETIFSSQENATKISLMIYNISNLYFLRCSIKNPDIENTL